MYIHKTSCISSQQTFGSIDLETLLPVVENKLYAKEPVYEGLPPGMLRRMGRAVRMGVGCSLPLLNEHADAIVVGSANGGMEDCIKFLNQIMDYEEGMLTPGNFVQSTPNATAAQLGLMTANHGYNITHVHRGLAFENALLDAMMLLKEHPGFTVLLEGLDEISTYNYNIDFLDGWYKGEPVTNSGLYTDTKGTVAGEGVAAFLVNNLAAGAIARVVALQTLHTDNPVDIKQLLDGFLVTHLPAGSSIDFLVSGENGDNRFKDFYNTVYERLRDCTIVRYKHMFGEFGTSTALALWLACQTDSFPTHAIMQTANNPRMNKFGLIYNMYKRCQHSLLLVELV